MSCLNSIVYFAADAIVPAGVAHQQVHVHAAAVPAHEALQTLLLRQRTGHCSCCIPHRLSCAWCMRCSPASVLSADPVLHAQLRRASGSACASALLAISVRVHGRHYFWCLQAMHAPGPMMPLHSGLPVTVRQWDTPQSHHAEALHTSLAAPTTRHCMWCHLWHWVRAPAASLALQQMTSMLQGLTVSAMCQDCLRACMSSALFFDLMFVLQVCCISQTLCKQWQLRSSKLQTLAPLRSWPHTSA